MLESNFKTIGHII